MESSSLESSDAMTLGHGSNFEVAFDNLRSRTVTRLTRLASLALVYFATGKLGLHFATINPSATAIWAPTGISSAACLLFGSWVWPAIFAGAFLVNVTTAGSIATSIGIAMGNTLEALAGAYLVRRFANGPNVFDRTQDAFKFVICAAVLSTTLSASIGVSSLCLAGYAPWSKYAWMWFTWWLGDCSGDLIVAPLLILWIRNPTVHWTRLQILEAALLVVWFAVTSGVVFGGWLTSQQLPIAFLYPPVLLWAAFRFGPRETSTVAFILSAIALACTIKGMGPFAQGTRDEALLLVQGFAGLTALMNIAVAIEVGARRRLEESKSRLAAIVDSSSDGIIAKTLDGRIATWNVGATRIFGFSASEAIGQPIRIIIPPEKFSEEEDVLSRVCRGETIATLETVCLRKDGQRIDISLTASPVRDSDGRIVGISKIARDITEEVRVRRERENFLRHEQAARQSAQAENRAKDEFLAMLGHELRNPLNAISLAARILENNKPSEFTKAQRIIARQATHVSRLVEDLLDVARVTTGRIVLVRQPTDLAECASNCLAALGETRQLEHHEIDTNIESIWVDGDSDRLEQIVANLLRNSVKYTPAGGRILISVQAQGEEAVLRVEDNGIGISADLLPRVFDLFAQGEVGLDRSRGGLGIGLTLVRRLVELHGGEVKAFSAGLDLGSTFIVHLPRIAAPVLGQPHSTKEATDNAAPRRILIVEDNADARESLRVTLELFGHQVYEACDGPTGMAQAAAIRPDLALIDLGLPGVDGFEVAKGIRSLPAGHEIVLIALTGYAQQEYHERAKKAGFNGYLIKPVDPHHLARFVATLSPKDHLLPQGDGMQQEQTRKISDRGWL
jgi:PAS domain S-box-containing protein